MRLLLVVVLAGTLAVPAQGATPISPEPDARFYQYETVEFTAERGPQDADLSVLFAPEAHVGDRWLDLGPQSPDEGHVIESVDVGWLATKFGRLGRFYWTVCPVAYGPEGELDHRPVLERCAPLSPFLISFRHPALTRALAKRYAREAMSERMRGAWRGGYGHKVSCRRATRTRQRCRVSWIAGDTVFFGPVTIYRKREQQWSAVRYRFSITRYDEYCHLVNMRPLRSCETRIRRSGIIG